MDLKTSRTQAMIPIVVDDLDVMRTESELAMIPIVVDDLDIMRTESELFMVLGQSGLQFFRYPTPEPTKSQNPNPFDGGCGWCRADQGIREILIALSQSLTRHANSGAVTTKPCVRGLSK